MQNHRLRGSHSIAKDSFIAARQEACLVEVVVSHLRQEADAASLKGLAQIVITFVEINSSFDLNWDRIKIIDVPWQFNSNDAEQVDHLEHFISGFIITAIIS